MKAFVKRRDRPAVGSIPDILGMFSREVRFYREIAPFLDVRTPRCLASFDEEWGTLLELEDLSKWTEGADPIRATTLLTELHRSWTDKADGRWPWLKERDDSLVIDLVGELFDAAWPDLKRRADLQPETLLLGERMFKAVPATLRESVVIGPQTLIHGDASLRNMRTAPDGEVALLDWEDVQLGVGVCDLAWLLVSSIEPQQWQPCIEAYGQTDHLSDALIDATVQGFLSWSDTVAGSPIAKGWVARLGEAGRRIFDS